MYHPTSRVLAVLELLQSGAALVSGADLADRLELDVRTIRRYILKLQDVGIPIESVPGRTGGYRLRPGHRLPPLLFSPEEGMAAFLALMGSSWLEVGQDSAAVEGALSKISRVLPQESRSRIESLARNLTVATPSGSRPLPEARALFDLGEAVQKSLLVELAYQAPGGGPTQRVVEPCGIVGRGGYWYLVAWCRMREGYRIFRLDRSNRYRFLSETFVARRPFDFRAFARAQLEDYPREHAVVVRFAASVDAVQGAFPVGSGTAEPDGEGCLWSTRATDLSWAAHEFLLTGWEWEVREPEALAAVLRESAARALRAASGARPSPGDGR